METILNTSHEKNFRADEFIVVIPDKLNHNPKLGVKYDNYDNYSKEFEDPVPIELTYVMKHIYVDYHTKESKPVNIYTAPIPEIYRKYQFFEIYCLHSDCKTHYNNSWLYKPHLGTVGISVDDHYWESTQIVLPNCITDKYCDAYSIFQGNENEIWIAVAQKK